MIKITLNDNTELLDLKLNGNNYISTNLIDSSVFENNLSVVKISEGDNETVYYDMKLVQNIVNEGKSWFILAEKNEEDKLKEKLEQSRADVDYLSIMTGVEL